MEHNAVLCRCTLAFGDDDVVVPTEVTIPAARDSVPVWHWPLVEPFPETVYAQLVPWQPDPN